MLNEFCLVGLALVGLGLVDLGLVGRGRCDAQCRVLGLCPDVRHRVGHRGRCGEPCPEGQLLHEVRLQQGEEEQRPLLVPRHDGLLQGLQLVGAKLIFMRDDNASNTGENA